MSLMLNIRDALELYTKLEKFTPDYEDIDDSLEFTSTIIHDIRQSDTPEAFGECLLLMYPDKTAKGLSEMAGDDIVLLFVEGLVENKFLALVEFCKVLGYD